MRRFGRSMTVLFAFSLAACGALERGVEPGATPDQAATATLGAVATVDVSKSPPTASLPSTATPPSSHTPRGVHNITPGREAGTPRALPAGVVDSAAATRSQGCEPDG